MNKETIMMYTIKSITYNHYIYNFTLYIIVMLYKVFNFKISNMILKLVNKKVINIQLYRNRYNDIAYNEFLNKGKNIEFCNSLFKDNTFYDFKINNFPYNFDNNYKHYVLWVHPSLTININFNEHIENIIVNHLKIIFKSYKKFYYFINAPSIKSIKNIQHIHVVIENPIFI